jgi:two-component SAPR family response regulator
MITNKLICTIVDNNINDAYILKEYLKNHNLVKDIKNFKNAYDGLLFISKYKVDLIFFNLETPYALTSGYLEKDLKLMPYILVTTTNKKKVIEIKKNSKILGYMLKPLNYDVINTFLVQTTKVVNANRITDFSQS